MVEFDAVYLAVLQMCGQNNHLEQAVFESGLAVEENS